MADETRIVTQPEGERFRLALEGPQPDAQGCERPVLHQGRLVHEGGSPELPIVHMVCWDSEDACSLTHGGEVRHVGDPERPVPLDMRHSTAKPVELDLRVSQVSHALGVQTTLQDPIHHALQLKTPIQVRFVNPWEAASQYSIGIAVGGRSVVEVSIRGKTVLTPHPAAPDPYEVSEAPRVQSMTDLLGRKET
jgi:hypothetical protein